MFRVCYVYNGYKDAYVITKSCIAKRVLFLLLFASIPFFAFNIYNSKPNPIIVSAECNSGSTKFLEYSNQFTGEVLNTGEAGYIVIDASLSQNGKKWNKSTIMFLDEEEKRPFKLVFDEVELGEGEVQYAYNTYAE